MPPKLLPVVISGGAGTRLWPLSTPDKPKQFHALTGSGTMIQETALRLRAAPGLEVLPPLLICNERHAAEAQAQMAAAGCAPMAMVLEPFGRNTAPVAMTAALIAGSIDPDILVLMMPSDHVIENPAAFAAAVGRAAPFARERIVLFGVKPSSAETGYGYIEAGAPIGGEVMEVARFVEKPDPAAAHAYVDSGRYSWNAGLFLFAPALMAAEIERLAPDVADAVRRALQGAQARDGVIALDRAAFGAAPSISLDYAVMERTDKAAVMPVDIGWTDIGSWDALWSRGPRDEAGNLVHGEVEAVDSQGCLLWSTDKPVVAVGLTDIMVVETPEAVLVLPRSRAQDVRLVAERAARKLIRSTGS